MERKKIVRSVWFWVAIVVVLMFVASSFFRGNSGYDEVPTSTALAQFQDGNVERVTINDKEQTLDLDLQNPVDGSSKVSASPAVWKGGARNWRTSTTSWSGVTAMTLTQSLSWTR